MKNQRATLDKIGAHIGVKGNDLSPWYNLSRASYRKLGLAGLLTQNYKSSQYAMLLKVYPEYDWLPWKFPKLPSNTGRDPKIIEKALKFVEKECKMTKPEDWYQISGFHLKALGVGSIFAQNGGPFQVLTQYRPDFTWKEEAFQ